MIIDHRTYRIKHGKTAEYIALFEEFAMPVQRRHIGEPINEVVHLWAYEAMGVMERKRTARDADPDWIAYKKKTAGMLLTQDNKIVKPTAISPIK